MWALIARERPRAGQGVLIDIGANIGTVCVPLQRRHAFRRTLAFEPALKNVELLRRNLRHNRIESSVQVFPVALSNADGEGTLWRSSFNYGDHRLNASGPAAEHAGSVIVPMRSLDGVLHEQSIEPHDVGMIWIDTQGHEFHILRGARSLVETATPLLLEFWPEALNAAGSDPEALLTMLRECYERFCVVDADMTLRPAAELTLGALGMPNGAHTDLLML